MKLAYLILAHNEFGVLERLLRALDDDHNDIFIHWDRKMDSYPAFVMERARLHVVENRVDVRWGDLSVVEAEYALFEAALGMGHFDYYHLLSGVDMPLRSQSEIRDFLSINNGKEFIGYSRYPGLKEEIERKMRWHLFPSRFQKEFRLSPSSVLRGLVLRLQSLLGIRREICTEIKKGTQWISVTDAFARYMVSKKRDVLNLFSHTFCCDELFVQTLCWNSSFRDHIFDLEDEGRGCMRAIGWKDGVLYPWKEDDYESLRCSDRLFARKFTMQHLKIVDRILSDVAR